MGKWSGMKETMVKFEQPKDWQQKIDELKHGTEGQPGLYSKSTLDLGEVYHNLRIEKEGLEAREKLINTEIEAISQILVGRLEDDGLTKITNKFGTFSIKDEPYTSVQDKQAFLKWVRETDQEELLTVPYATTNALAKKALEDGESLPPGVTVFMKSSITRRKV
jgi:hypothetical protein